MEGGRITDQKKKNNSFGFNFADEKMKLIDIQLEDDDFLVASHFCEDFLPGVGLIEQEEDNFLRRSFAWDSAFFNSAGVLDPDELSFMNRGFRKTETHLLSGTNDVRNRTEVHDFCAEVEPMIFNPMPSKALNVFDKSPELEPRQKGMQASKKVDESCRSKPTSRGRNGRTPSPLPQKAIVEATNISGKSCLKMDKRSTTSCSIPKRETDPGKIRHASSFPASKIWRQSGRNKGKWNDTNGSTRSLSLSSSIESKDAKEASALKGSLQSSLSSANSSQASLRRRLSSALKSSLQSALSSANSSQALPKTRLSTQTLRPSGLRPPSPPTRFSHENYNGETRTRKLPQSKGTPFGCSNNGNAASGKKLKTPCSDAPKNIKRPKLESSSNSQVMKQGKYLETGRVAVDQEKGMKKPSYSIDRLENLSRYFEAIDLNQEKRVLKQGNRTRTPLLDKTFSCNFSGTYQRNIRGRS